MALPSNFNPITGSRLVYLGSHNGETGVEFTVLCSCGHSRPVYFRRSEIKANLSMYDYPNQSKSSGGDTPTDPQQPSGAYIKGDKHGD